MTKPGTLYLCATPIGNLGDITLRVLETLRMVDLIACEDTRKTLGLLNHFAIQKPVTSYFEHNKAYKGERIIVELLSGKNVALVSDAGMPGVSDPGWDLIQKCLAHEIPYTVLPGPVAAVTALVLSGLPTERFTFEGFIPRDKRERQALFTALASEERTMIFYEAPHRLLETLSAMHAAWGDRAMACCRELTKKFEEVVRGSTSEVLSHFTAHGVKGEFVLVVHGAPPPEAVTHDLDWAVQRAQALLAEGLPVKDASRQAAQEAGLSKRDVYNQLMKRKNHQEE